MRNFPAVRLIEEKIGPGPEPIVVRAPGRVNIIGEHTDYNEGYVLPFAIDRFTEVAIRPRRDSKVVVYSHSFDDVLCTELSTPPLPAQSWQDYIVGILWECSKIFVLNHGFEAAIWSNVPVGAGLSSSAALEVAFALALLRLYTVDVPGLELVKLCQRAERDFVGMPCGIMDQYVAYFAKAGTALLLDTRSLEHRYVPLNLTDVAFLVVDSKVRRALAGSGYGERRRECQEAVRWLASEFPEKSFRALRDVDEDLLQKVHDEMPDVLYKRTMHVIKENARVLAMVRALLQENWEEAGRLLYASHESLRDLFQVSVPEVDFLVGWGMEHGALGARLVGGGFGGITLHLVPRADSWAYSQGIRMAYQKSWEREPIIFEFMPADGAKILWAGED